MTRLRVLLARVLGLVSGRRRDATLDEEIQAHLDLLTEEHCRAGLSKREARLAARRAFGGVEQIKETYRDQGGLPLIEVLVQDIRYALRMLRKAPGFAVLTILVLALGIGANSATFSLVDAALIRPLPFPNAERLAMLFDLSPSLVRTRVTPLNFIA
jgi:hypothetical protein